MPEPRRPGDDVQLDHIRDKLWRIDKDNNLMKALKHSAYETIIDIFSMSEDEITSLRYIDDTGNNPQERPLMPGLQTKLRTLISSVLGIHTVFLAGLKL